jgi:hypothetical protein
VYEQVAETQCGPKSQLAAKIRLALAAAGNAAQAAASSTLVLNLLALLVHTYKYNECCAGGSFFYSGTQFTSFTSANVPMLTQMLSLLASSTRVLNLLALLVQMYKC